MNAAVDPSENRRVALDASRMFSAQSISKVAGIAVGIVIVRALGPTGKGALS